MNITCGNIFELINELGAYILIYEDAQKDQQLLEYSLEKLIEYSKYEPLILTLNYFIFGILIKLSFMRITIPKMHGI